MPGTFNATQTAAEYIPLLNGMAGSVVWASKLGISPELADNTDEIQAGMEALAADGGGVILYPPGQFLHGGTIELVSNVLHVASWATTLKWTGGASAQISSPTSGALDRCGIENFIIDCGGASRAIELLSPYDCHFRRLRIASASSTNQLIYMGVNTTGGTNAEGNRNAAACRFDDIKQVSGYCGTMLEMVGGSGAGEVVTLNTFANLYAARCDVRGIALGRWCDSNRWSGLTRLAILANDAVGVEHNHTDPTSDVGVYANDFDHLAVDAFGSLAGRVGMKINFADLITVSKFFQDPAAEGGQLVLGANAGYSIQVNPAGTNDLRDIRDARSARRGASGCGLPYILAKSGAAATVSATASEEALATVSIPAGAMAANGMLRVTTLWSCTNSANNKTPRVRLGGLSGTDYANLSFNSMTGFRIVTEIINANSAGGQIGHSNIRSDGGESQQLGLSSAVDTTAAVDLVISGQKASAGETLALTSYLVELIANGA